MRNVNIFIRQQRGKEIKKNENTMNTTNLITRIRVYIAQYHHAICGDIYTVHRK